MRTSKFRIRSAGASYFAPNARGRCRNLANRNHPSNRWTSQASTTSYLIYNPKQNPLPLRPYPPNKLPPSSPPPRRRRPDLPAPVASYTLLAASSTLTSHYLSRIWARQGRPWPDGPALAGIPRLDRRGIRRGQSRRVPPRGAARWGGGQQWSPTLPPTWQVLADLE